MKRLRLIFLLCIPTLSLAAGLELSAIDFKNCIRWDITDGDPAPSSKEKPYGPDVRGHWGRYAAFSSDGRFYADRCLSANDDSFTCEGSEGFPLGTATWVLSKTVDPPINFPVFRCIANCETAKVKVIYATGEEVEVENSAYLQAIRKAKKVCGKKARDW